MQFAQAQASPWLHYLASLGSTSPKAGQTESVDKSSGTSAIQETVVDAASSHSNVVSWGAVGEYGGNRFDYLAITNAAGGGQWVWAWGASALVGATLGVVSAVAPAIPAVADATGPSVFGNGSGAQQAAVAWAGANGGRTLAVAANATEAEVAAASASFAATASGNVVVFQSAAFEGATAVRVSAGASVWARHELPALTANPNVTGITWKLLNESGQIVRTIVVPK